MNRLLESRRSLCAAACLALLAAPDTVAAGAQLTVGWTGPANAGDRIAIATPEQAARQQMRYAYVDPDAGTVSLQVPGEPGTYELRYILASDRRVIASKRIEVGR